jgi:hypothetical protein
MANQLREKLPIDGLLAKPLNNSKYDKLIVQAYKVRRLYNVLAYISLWILLAGFVISPATFPSLQTSPSLASSTPGKVVHIIQNAPLLAIAIPCFVIGATGIIFLWITNNRDQNYVWLNDRLFLYVIAFLTNLHKAKLEAWVS